ncbi:hypothetical protein KKB18_04820 [bacterium]|nr:hypothetical protein [bacterium]
MNKSLKKHLLIELFTEKFRIVSDVDKVINFFEILYPESRKIEHIQGSFHDFCVLQNKDIENHFTISFEDQILDIDSPKYLITYSYLNFMKFFPLKIKKYFLFHGASFHHKNKGFIIIGPPGYGKTTLSFSLSLQDLNLLSDELGSISMEDEKLYPYNKLPTVREDILKFFPDHPVIKAEMHLLDDTKKFLIDIRKNNSFENVGCKLNFIFILSNPDQNKIKSSISHLILEKFDTDILKKLESIEGFELIEIYKKGKYPIIFFDSQNVANTRKNIQSLCEEIKIQILSMESARFSRPDFNREPALIPIDKTHGITELCEYLKGGLESGIAKYSFKGNVLEIFFHLMNIFKNTNF